MYFWLQCFGRSYFSFKNSFPFKNFYFIHDSSLHKKTFLTLVGNIKSVLPAQTVLASWLQKDMLILKKKSTLIYVIILFLKVRDTLTLILFLWQRELVLEAIRLHSYPIPEKDFLKRDS